MFIPKQYIETLCKWKLCILLLAFFQLNIISLSIVYVYMYSIPLYGSTSIYLPSLLFMDIFSSYFAIIHNTTMNK